MVLGINRSDEAMPEISLVLIDLELIYSLHDSEVEVQVFPVSH